MANTFLDRGRIFEIDSATVTQVTYLEYIYYPLYYNGLSYCFNTQTTETHLDKSWNTRKF